MHTINDKRNISVCAERGDFSRFADTTQAEHRCKGDGGGHPDMIAWEISEKLHDIFPSVERQLDVACNASGTNQICCNTSYVFEEIWPLMKRKLCPNMKPRTHLGSIMFLQAQKELKMEHNGEKIFHNLRSFQDRGWSYKANGTDIATVYLRIFKAANNQIVGHANSTFSKRGDIFSLTSLSATLILMTPAL